MKYYYKKNRLILFWHIGKYVYQSRKNKFKSYREISMILKYYFGFTDMFSISSIKNMEKFYVSFPVYTEVLERLDWKFYEKLLLFNDTDLRMIYFRVAIVSECEFSDFERTISNRIIQRI